MYLTYLSSGNDHLSGREQGADPMKAEECKEVRAAEVMPKVDKIRKVPLSNDERDSRLEPKRCHQAAADVDQTLQQASAAVDALSLHTRI